MTTTDRSRSQAPAVDTQTLTWALAFLGPVVALLWKTGNFSLWDSMAGIIFVLLLSAVADKSVFSDSAFVVYSAIKALCYILVFGVIIQYLLEISPSQHWKISVPQDANNSFDITFGQAAFFVIWIIFWRAIYMKERSKIQNPEAAGDHL